MKTRRLVRIPKRLFDRLNAVCANYMLYRYSFVATIIDKEVNKMNKFKPDSSLRVKEEYVNLDLNVNLESYDKIKGNKTQKIIRILDEVLTDYENGIERYK
ncbi:MAG: hypothetical protein Q8936_21645 [Bacillota bacterium]|nr:hypothetical protein [Bacillota bacterium]